MSQQQPLGDLSLSGGSYPNLAFLLTLIGAILILIGALYEIVIGLAVSGTYGVIGAAAGAIVAAFGVIALILGLIILFFAWRLRHPTGGVQTTAILIIVFSLISFIGDAFYIGSILALVGGILALVWKPSAPMGMPQANAWGQATPPAAPYGAPPPPGAPPPMTPPPGTAPPAAAPAAPFCSNCGKPTTFVPQYNRYYCYDCKQYV